MGPDDAFICSLNTGGSTVLANLMNTPVCGCRKGDPAYLTHVTPEGLASKQDRCQGKCSFVNNRCPQVRVRDSYSAPRGSKYAVVREMLVNYGNGNAV